MNSKIIYNIIFITYILLFSSCNYKKEKNSNQIIIATAANMQFVMKEIVKVFNKDRYTECNIVISSSGKLTAQIKEGAPYDLFVAANMKYPEEIYKSGISYNSPKVYALGKLVLWSVNEDIKPSLNLLTDSKINHIALANPKTAPYGFAAVEALKKLNLHKSVEHKLVYGESISQTNQFITLESAELGFTAMSVVLSPKMKNKGNWITIDNSYYSPINQGVILIKRKDKINPLAIDFYNFLFSEKVVKILKKYGYDQ